MPRAARVVFPGVPHHITQRGNRRGLVFFTDDDRLSYLDLMREYTSRHSVSVVAYCLMPNHVHLVLVPSTVDGLHQALRPLHMRHAQRLNYWRNWSGHVWQARFFSSPLDEDYFWAALRYVELNPVRAGLVQRPGDYRWSSAAARCRGEPDRNIATDPLWQRKLESVANWSDWLAVGLDSTALESLRGQSRRCLPCGSDEFVDTLERASGRCLRPRPRGPRPGGPNRDGALIRK